VEINRSDHGFFKVIDPSDLLSAFCCSDLEESALHPPWPRMHRVGSRIVWDGRLAVRFARFSRTRLAPANDTPHHLLHNHHLENEILTSQSTSSPRPQNPFFTSSAPQSRIAAMNVTRLEYDPISIG